MLDTKASTVLEKAPWFAHYDQGVPEHTDIPNASLCSLLDHAAEHFPKRKAIVFQNQTITYKELQKKAEQMAAALQKRGVRSGDRVSIMLPNLPQTILSFWGVLKAGAVVVMTNPLYMESELLHQIKDAGIKHIITLDIFFHKIEPLWDKLELEVCYITRIRDALQFPLNYIQPFSAYRNKTWVPLLFDNTRIVPWKSLITKTARLAVPIDNPNDTLAMLQYTGGTTGIAKGAMLTHGNLMANIHQIIALIQEKPENQHTFIALLPLFHIFGLTLTLILPAYLAAMVVPMPRYVPADMLASFKKYKFTVFIGAPSVYIALLQQKDLGKHDLSHIQFCISGSASLPLEWLQRFKEVTNTAITEGFGLSEASPVTHANPMLGKQKAGSIGVPLPNTQARIVDMEDSTKILEPNAIGELLVKGPQVMKSYWNQAAETAIALRDGWLYTGDIAYMDEEGYFHIVDRKKDLIIVNGFNVFPREIDELLVTHPKILEAVCIGAHHKSRGETIKAYIVVKTGKTLDVPEVIAFCKKQLASYKIPRIIEFREELPKSLVGKVLRRVLREEETKTQ